jgi:hypothetical protein
MIWIDGGTYKDHLKHPNKISLLGSWFVLSMIKPPKLILEQEISWGMNSHLGQQEYMYALLITNLL